MYIWFCFHWKKELRKMLSWVDVAVAAKTLQSCPTLCDPTDGSPPGSTIPGILQARTLEWIAISFSNAWKWKVKVKSTQSCPTLPNSMDCSLPGSSVPGIFQAGVLEWGAISFSCYSPPNSLDPAAWASLLHQEWMCEMSSTLGPWHVLLLSGPFFFQMSRCL